MTPELWWDQEKCVDDKECMRACPQGAISRDNPDFIDRNICTLCFECVDVCPSKALTRVGQRMSVDDIVEKVVRFKPFFDTSGGGVTLSGGEPTLPMEFTSVLLKSFKANRLHTLLETAGLFEFRQFESLVLPYVDLIFFDIKFIDSTEHEHYCGIKNERILRNFISLHQKSLSCDFELLPRTPLIPGITDTETNIGDIAAFYQRHNVRRIALVPNNPAWIPKLDKLGQKATFDANSPMRRLYSDEKKKKINERFIRAGIEVVRG